MLLHDEPGALAKITKILGQFGVSIDRMRQYGHEDESAPVLIVTHETKREDLMRAIQQLPTHRAKLASTSSNRNRGGTNKIRAWT